MDKRFSIILAALFSVNANANMVTVDFEDVAWSLTHQTIDYFEDGVTISLEAGHYDIWGPTFDNPDANRFLNLDNESGVVDSFPTSQVRFDMGGAIFNLVDLVVLYAGNQLNQIRTSAGGVYDITESGLVTLTGAEWENISWFTFSVTGLGVGPAQGYENTGIDNIRLTHSIPNPGTLSLVLLGTGFLIGFRSRHRTI